MFRKCCTSVLRLVFITLVPAQLCGQWKDSWGLEFIEERPNTIETTLDLTPESLIPVKESIFIEFDLSILNSRKYGNIVFLHDDKNQFECNLVYYHHSNKDTSFLQLNVNESPTQIICPIAKKNLHRGNWMSIQLYFDFTSHLISGSLNDTFLVKDTMRFPSVSRLAVQFGGYEQERDTPPMAIRDVRIIKDQPISSHHYDHRWKLNEADGEAANDEADKSIAAVRQPHWLEQDHFKWRYRGEVQAANDIELYVPNTVFLFPGKSAMLEYDLLNDRQSIMTYSNRRPSRAVYAIPFGRKIGVYHYGGGCISLFDRTDTTWTPIDDRSDDDMHFYGNCTLVDSVEPAAYMFAGYGWYTMKNILQKYDFKTSRWNLVPLNNKDYLPRYNIVSSPSTNPQIFYLLGGIGNKSGNQQDGMYEIHDLWTIRLNTPLLTKLQDFVLPQEVKGITIPDGVRNFYVEKDTQLYCIARLREYKIESSDTLMVFQLYTSKLDTIVLRPIGEKIFLKKDEGLAGLYHSIPSKEFVILIANAIPNTDSLRYRFYTLAYPPISEVEYSSLLHASLLNLKGIVIIVSSVLGILIFLLFVVRYKSRVLKKGAEVTAIAQKSFSTKVAVNQTSAESLSTGIYLFGGLRIISRMGIDITHRFSPLSKQLLILFLLHSNHKNRPLTTQHLTTILWPELNQQHAKNARGSAVKKLRDSLLEVGDAIINIDDNHWQIVLGSAVYCDYYEYLHLRSRFSEAPNSETCYRLLAVISNGALIPEHSYEWLDPIKVIVEEEVVSLCLKAAKNYYSEEDAELLIKIAMTILAWDSVNEPAIALKIQSLTLQGRNGEALLVFDQYCKAYQTLHGRPYKKSFDEVMDFNPFVSNNHA